MKIAISGISSGFGKFVASQLSASNEIVRVSLRDSIDSIVNIVQTCDVFLNLAYSNDTKQSEVFYKVFQIWKDKEKTIVNFGTSAIYEGGEFSPLYVANKKHLINLSHTLSNANPYKKVRVININPGTLENNKIFKGKYNHVTFQDLFSVLEFILYFNKNLEISDITIKPVTRLIKNNI